METFTAPRQFVQHPNFLQDRGESHAKLDYSAIDPPIIDIVRGFSRISFCFTLQCCWGHFLYAGNQDPLNIEPLPPLEDKEYVEYRIAYLAVCIQESIPGGQLLDRLADIASIDREYVQFGSADWFWERQVNSYALQVEPERFKDQDKCRLAYEEAVHVQNVRTMFFNQLRSLLLNREGRLNPSHQ